MSNNLDQGGRPYANVNLGLRNYFNLAEVINFEYGKEININKGHNYKFSVTFPCLA